MLDPADPPFHAITPWQLRTLIITIILSIVGYFLFTLWGGWEEVLEAIFKVGFLATIISLLLSLVNYGLRFIRWQTFLEVLGYQIPFWANLRIYIAGFSLTTTPGKAGEMLRSVFLRKYGVGYRQSVGAFFAERVSDLIAVLILASLGLWIYPGARPFVLAGGFLITFILIGIQKKSWLKAIENGSKKLFPNKFAHIIEFFIETVLAFRSCFALRILIYGIFLGVIAWAAEGLALYYILYSLGYDVGILVAMFGYGFSMLIGGLSLLPGGLGAAEVVLLQILVLFDVPLSVAIAATLVIRLVTLWFAVLLGLIILPYTQ